MATIPTLPLTRPSTAESKSTMTGTDAQPGSSVAYPVIDELPDRLNEQHHITTATLGFLLHPHIPPPPPPGTPYKIADIGTGTGIFLLSLAPTLPPSTHLIGFDITPSSFPPLASHPPNITFTTHDMLTPFPPSHLSTFDVVTARFLSSATPRAAWEQTIRNLVTLLKPGGWLQWIDSCNFQVYCAVPGTSRAACREVYKELEPFRAEGAVVGLMMRDAGADASGGREEVWRGCGLVEVHEDVFSTDRLVGDQGGEWAGLREKGTRNVMECFLGCLEGLVGVEGSGWTRERWEGVKAKVEDEVRAGVYHTLDQVCLVGRKPVD
ncbi:S-adenosyl-L-methionine-dependent methyltransferase [Schizothecium vesticola]|uniref:S-adenosyl-L-methionine-dependent methyltransferase n=1 Tax=Schizothecium vesticola TaxID=314040 RepID=A0AA40K7N5_9PEZI|nr:S-adenosyl-L-methionine-dependent methyltransferase [Schizothecium vesticola]